MKGLFGFLIAAALLTACDYVDEPVVPATDGGGANDTIILRKVLLEEFTGHRCSTCPAAHVVAKQLSTLYGSRLVIVGIHATSTFAAPLSPPAADGRYSTDFRTPAGDTYTTTFGVSFLPTGMISRKPFNSSTTVAQGTWGSAISELIEQPALAQIWFDDLQFNAANSTLTAAVKVRAEQPIDEDHKLTLYLVEDRVFDWQLNADVSPPDVPDYEHRHVLRGAVNGTWGGNAVAAGTAVGDTLTVPVNGYSLDPSWDPAKCYLVAYLYNTATNEVMQVVEQKIQP